jgi:voltage-gated potassium channel
MFTLSLAFLVCQATLVVVWFDVPNFTENAKAFIAQGNPASQRVRAALAGEMVDHRIQDAAVALGLLIWPAVILESVFHWLTRPWDATTRRYHGFSLLFCLCPSFRMCARSPEMGYRIWLPGLGWRRANKRLRRRLERQFSIPMILIALLILPVMLVEFYMKTQVVEYGWLRMLLHISAGIIWFAFAFEFILMVSVADKKLTYCKTHWLDIAIILLPFFSFLRSLRVLRASQITKMARVYRLRGTAVRAFRGLILLEFFHRFLGMDLEQRIRKLERQLDEVESEAKEIRRRITRLQRQQQERAAEIGSGAEEPGN